MDAFTRLDAVAVPFPEPNIDTDRIVPARFLRKQRADGFGQYLFHDQRFDAAHGDVPDFALNRPAWRDAKILVAGPNFGCGSSREMAVWALADYGIRALLSARFADIFRGNCFRLGLLPIVLPEADVAALMQRLADRPGLRIAIDLEAQTLTAEGGASHAFDVDPFNRKCLLRGLDTIDYTLSHADAIAAYESAHRPAPVS